MKPLPFELMEPESPAEYGPALNLMRRVHGLRIAGEIKDTLILLEHAPVITLGANASTGGVLAGSSELERLGVPVHRIERGGEATCHLPGQLVAYPIFSLRARGLGVRAFVNALEEAMLSTAALYGVEAWRIPGSPGIYCAAGKLGAVGVAVKSGVTLHGVALNIDCDLRFFDLIIPCGSRETPPASLSSALGQKLATRAAREVFLKTFSEIFGRVSRRSS